MTFETSSSITPPKLVVMVAISVWGSQLRQKNVTRKKHPCQELQIEQTADPPSGLNNACSPVCVHPWGGVCPVHAIAIHIRPRIDHIPNGRDGLVRGPPPPSVSACWQCWQCWPLVGQIGRCWDCGVGAFISVRAYNTSFRVRGTVKWTKQIHASGGVFFWSIPYSIQRFSFRNVIVGPKGGGGISKQCLKL